MKKLLSALLLSVSLSSLANPVVVSCYSVYCATAGDLSSCSMTAPYNKYFNVFTLIEGPVKKGHYAATNTISFLQGGVRVSECGYMTLDGSSILNVRNNPRFAITPDMRGGWQGSLLSAFCRIGNSCYFDLND